MARRQLRPIGELAICPGLKTKCFRGSCDLVRAGSSRPLLFLDDQRYTPVFLPSLWIVAAVGLLIGHGRLQGTKPRSLELLCRETAAGLEPQGDRRGTSLRQLLVVGIATL